jgi:hypothetical protein
MSRIRLVLLTLVSLLALGGLSSASASAAECPDTIKGGDNALCIEGKEAAPGTYPFTDKLTSATAVLAMAGGPTFTCKKETSTGEFEVPGDGEPSGEPSASDIRLEFTECKVTNSEANCELSEPIVVEGGTGDNLDAELNKARTELTYTPSEGTTFTTFKVKSKLGKTCAFAGSYVVKGSQACKLPGDETEATTHTVECLASGSKLTAAEKQVTFTATESVQLTSGKKYSVKES